MILLNWGLFWGPDVHTYGAPTVHTPSIKIYKFRNTWAEVNCILIRLLYCRKYLLLLQDKRYSIITDWLAYRPRKQKCNPNFDGNVFNISMILLVHTPVRHCTTFYSGKSLTCLTLSQSFFQSVGANVLIFFIRHT